MNPYGKRFPRTKTAHIDGYCKIKMAVQHEARLGAGAMVAEFVRRASNARRSSMFPGPLVGGPFPAEGRKRDPGLQVLLNATHILHEGQIKAIAA